MSDLPIAALVSSTALRDEEPLEDLRRESVLGGECCRCFFQLDGSCCSAPLELVGGYTVTLGGVDALSLVFEDGFFLF